MKVIEIRVQDKRAISPDATIVCGNNDYKIKFDFDTEWERHNFKTARFAFNGSYIDVVFEGDTVNAPIITNASMVAVGVYAGDLQTTTPALIATEKSILCGDGLPAEPLPDVYAQIMELLNNVTGGNGGGAVASVNGKTGKVVLNAKDVGALPADTDIPNIDGLATETFVNDRIADTIPNWAKQPEKPKYTAEEVCAEPLGAAENKVSTHNTDETAHNDIRVFLSQLNNRINGIADSDDTTLDQLSEIVAYIKTNKSLIDSITTSKVNVTDIIDNLVTSVADKPLSAKQGVELLQKIDANRAQCASDDRQNVKKADLLNMVYPIGSIYMSVSETSPALLMGGTWERIKDRFLLACGDTYTALSTGGEAEHTLTTEELPKHAHIIGTTEHESGADISQWQAVGVRSQTEAEPVKYYGASTSFVGSGRAHNNIPPYFAVYMWIRKE